MKKGRVFLETSINLNSLLLQKIIFLFKNFNLYMISKSTQKTLR